MSDPRASFGPVLDAFRAVDGPVMTARDVAAYTPDLTETDARAALRQLEIDGVAMSKELESGCRLWWLRTYHGGDDLQDARQAQARHHASGQRALTARIGD